ncbi:MAG: MSHA biogenesis protein MshO [Cellvibrionaceae bacterium]|jgi:MSHA biogenesis protein MshO
MKVRVLVKNQSHVLIDSQLTMDRLDKQLRLALPFSLRVTNGNRCLSFLTVVADGFYLNEVSDQNNSLPSAGRDVPINVSSYNLLDGDAIFLSIGAGSSSEAYGNPPPH